MELYWLPIDCTLCTQKLSRRWTLPEGQPYPSCTDGRKVASCVIADILVDAIDAAVDFQG